MLDTRVIQTERCPSRPLDRERSGLTPRSCGRPRVSCRRTSSSLACRTCSVCLHAACRGLPHAGVASPLYPKRRSPAIAAHVRRLLLSFLASMVPWRRHGVGLSAHRVRLAAGHGPASPLGAALAPRRRACRQRGTRSAAAAATSRPLHVQPQRSPHVLSQQLRPLISTYWPHAQAGSAQVGRARPASRRAPRWRIARPLFGLSALNPRRHLKDEADA
eukprot:6184066-Pleurochrysis_carterae.AAC.4